MQRRRNLTSKPIKLSPDLPRGAEWMIRGAYTPSLGFKQHPLEDAGQYSIISRAKNTTHFCYVPQTTCEKITWEFTGAHPPPARPPLFQGVALHVHLTWRIIIFSKWFMTIVNKSLKDRVVPLPNGPFMAYRWAVILTTYIHSHDPPSNSLKPTFCDFELFPFCNWLYPP